MQWVIPMITIMMMMMIKWTIKFDEDNKTKRRNRFDVKCNFWTAKYLNEKWWRVAFYAGFFLTSSSWLIFTLSISARVCVCVNTVQFDLIILLLRVLPISYNHFCIISIPWGQSILFDGCAYLNTARTARPKKRIFLRRASIFRRVPELVCRYIY